MTTLQRDVFLKSEGDSWYTRNAPSHEIVSADFQQTTHQIIEVIERANIKPTNILEIGCSAGARLAAIANHFGAQGAGIDPGAAAIVEGGKRFTGLRLAVGTADKLDFADDAFDLVIFGFCFYLIDPKLHFRCVAEADRVLSDGGSVVIHDFFEPSPYRNDYSHTAGVFSHKMDFSRYFIASPNYTLLGRHAKPYGSDAIVRDKRVTIDLVRKDLQAAFAVQSSGT